MIVDGGVPTVDPNHDADTMIVDGGVLAVDPNHDAETKAAEIQGSTPDTCPDSPGAPDCSKATGKPVQEANGIDRADTQEYGAGVALDFSDGRLQQPEVCWHPAVDMVMATPDFPGWEDPEHVVPLKDYLAPNFQQGLDPEQDMQPLLRPVVSWMQQLSQTPCETVWGMESQKGINAFTTFVNSCSRLQNKISVTKSTFEAACKAAKQSLDEISNKLPPNHSKIQSKRDVLQKWLVKRQDQFRQALMDEEKANDKAGAAFLEEVRSLAVAAFQEYSSEPPLDEELVFAELDEQVMNSMKCDEFPGQQPEDVVPQELAPEVVPQTKAFENMQQLVGDAFQKAGAKLDAAQQEKLSQSLGEIFKKNMFEPEKPNKPKLLEVGVLKPIGDFYL